MQIDDLYCTNYLIQASPSSENYLQKLIANQHHINVILHIFHAMDTRNTRYISSKLHVCWLKRYNFSNMFGLMLLYVNSFTEDLLTPRCRVLPEQLTGLQLVKKFPRHFTEPEGSSPHPQPSANCLYPGPAQSSPYAHIPPPADPS